MGVHFRIKEKELSLEIRDRHSFVKCALTVTLFVGTSAEVRDRPGYSFRGLLSTEAFILHSRTWNAIFKWKSPNLDPGSHFFLLLLAELHNTTAPSNAETERLERGRANPGKCMVFLPCLKARIFRMPYTRGRPLSNSLMGFSSGSWKEQEGMDEAFRNLLFYVGDAIIQKV